MDLEKPESEAAKPWQHQGNLSTGNKGQAVSGSDQHTVTQPKSEKNTMRPQFQESLRYVGVTFPTLEKSIYSYVFCAIQIEYSVTYDKMSPQLSLLVGKKQVQTRFSKATRKIYFSSYTLRSQTLHQALANLVGKLLLVSQDMISVKMSQDNLHVTKWTHTILK